MPSCGSASPADSFPQPRPRELQSNLIHLQQAALGCEASGQLGSTTPTWLDGREFKSERIAWGGRSYNRQSTEAERKVARYPAGSRISVHYSPAKPSHAVFEPAEKGGLD